MGETARASHTIRCASGSPTKGTGGAPGAADAAESGKLELIAAEGLARKLRFALHVEGREGLQAAALCRQGVKELVGVQQQIAATLGAMEAGEK